MPRFGEVTRHCPSDDGCIALGYQHAGQPIGAEDGDDPPKRSSRIVHDLQDAMTEHHVGGLGPEQVVQVGRRSSAASASGLGSTTVTRCP